MSFLKQTWPYILVVIISYGILPLLQMGYGLFYIPVVIFFTGLVFGIRKKMNRHYLFFILTVGVLSVPLVLVLLNEPAIAYPFIFSGCALLGSLIGRLLSMKAP